MEHLPLGRIAALVPEFAVNDLPLGRTLIIIYIYIYKSMSTCVCVSHIGTHTIHPIAMKLSQVVVNMHAMVMEI